MNIQGFQQDIYDQVIEVRFLAKLRDEVRFDGVDQLVRQMRKDKENAVPYWK